MFNFKSLSTLICATAIAASTLLQAQSDSKDAKIVIPDPVPQENTWEYKIAPYAWLSGIEGTSGVKGIEAAVDMPLDDILDILEFAGYLAFEANKGNWGCYADLQYIKLSGGDSVLRGPIKADVEMNLEQFHMELGVKYRIYHNENTTIRLIAGVQYTYFALDMKIEGNRISTSADGSEDWVDPTVGITFDHRFTEKWGAHLTGQVGGFGVSSDFTWQVLAGVGYAISDNWNLIGGWRHQYIDYENDGFVYDLDIGGPILGATYQF